jgi:small subunit ribosomal protein S8
MITDIVPMTLTRIRNAVLVKLEFVRLPVTNVTRQILQLLVEEKFIYGFAEARRGIDHYFLVYLKYYGTEQKSAITTIKPISKRGLRIYTSSKRLQKVLGGVGTAILSTSKGIMTDREAREKNVGGEVLCHIW